ncbi:MAG: AAA family ATPase [Spirochaetaceae bacterium]|nr:AAA family ATPase [Spirochaetaceae bacterium]
MTTKKKTQCNTKNLQRLEEVLVELNINYKITKEGHIILTDEDVLIDELENLYKHIDKAEEYIVVGITENGELIDSDDYVFYFRLCNSCHKFYLDYAQREECFYCKGNNLTDLESNGKIPNWHPFTKEFIIDPTYEFNYVDSLTDKKQRQRENIVNKLSGEVKYITVTEEQIFALKNLEKKYPNMKKFFKYLYEQIELSKMKIHGELSLKPSVLVGNAGSGKTSCVVEVSRILQGKSAIRIDLGNDIAIFTCTGSDPTFSDAKQGRIIESMFAEDDGHPIKNPIVLFDELDKINQNAKNSIETLFYSILEKSTSKYFTDNFLGIEVDASGINYIFTANSLDSIPKPILNRLRIFEIPDYTEDQFRTVVIDSFYENWLNSNNLKREFFPEVLSDEIKDEIIKISKGDSRSINDAFTELFVKTMRIDDKTGERIALFSASELCGGWQHYRGKSNLSLSKWKLPQ